MRLRHGVALAAIVSLFPAPALAGFDGATFGPAWAIPFVGILLSIAVLPQLAHHFWDRHMGALAGFWALATLGPLALAQGLGATGEALVHVALAEYLPFVLLLLALYTIAGGIVVIGTPPGSPGTNTALLALGTALASLIGTTGASMVLIRPLLRANEGRRHNVHVVVFFIFLVSNVGGALSPLGDPPLFLGFLRGVDFSWPLRHLLWPTCFVTGLLLVLFHGLDLLLWRRERPDAIAAREPRPVPRLRLRGRANLVLLAIAIGTVAVTGTWRPGNAFRIGETAIGWQSLVRDAILVALALLSWRLTSHRDRAANDFSWRPIAEVAKIFAGIFACMIPVTAALAAGRNGLFAPLLALVSRGDGGPEPVAYFWLTGLLSSVLDNAPTYLVFFDLAGGDAGALMGPLAGTLGAISMGAVFMGALTYIGNAPNFMVYAIARQAGIAMPGFLGYLVWSGTILLPVFALVTLVFLR